MPMPLGVLCVAWWRMVWGCDVVLCCAVCVWARTHRQALDPQGMQLDLITALKAVIRIIYETSHGEFVTDVLRMNVFSAP